MTTCLREEEEEERNEREVRVVSEAKARRGRVLGNAHEVAKWLGGEGREEAGGGVHGGGESGVGGWWGESNEMEAERCEWEVCEGKNLR